jgi:integrase/recombinase XerD
MWQGKGEKVASCPIGERAVAWVDKYLREARPQLASDPDDGTVFLSVEGGAVSSRPAEHAGANMSSRPT